MTHSRSGFVPAAGFRWLTALYDPVVALTTRERTFKRALIAQAQLRPGARLLDLGCGTGTLAIWAKQAVPTAIVTGVDADSEILRRARAKAEKAGADVSFDEALSHSLPYRGADFDRVTSSLFFHHLSHEAKRQTLAECHRVLRPGGELHVADFGKPANGIARLSFLFVRLLDGFDVTADNVAGRLPGLFEEAGFASVQIVRRFASLFGTLELYRATRPAA